MAAPVVEHYRAACVENGLAVSHFGRLCKAELGGTSDHVWAPRDMALCEVMVSGRPQHELLYFLPGLPPTRPKGMLSIGGASAVGDVGETEAPSEAPSHVAASLTQAWLSGATKKTSAPPLPPADGVTPAPAKVVGILKSVRPKLHLSDSWKKVRHAVKAAGSAAGAFAHLATRHRRGRRCRPPAVARPPPHLHAVPPRARAPQQQRPSGRFGLNRKATAPCCSAATIAPSSKRGAPLSSARSLTSHRARRRSRS
jgi:hypothetical protein